MRKPYYGWFLVFVGLFCYGLGISPAYYSWGFFAPELIDELGFTRQQVGNLFGVFTLMFSISAPLAGWAIQRWGVRVVVTTGALICSCGFALTSRAESPLSFYLGFSFIGGIGIGLSTILPAQTIAVYWFKRYRARATAIILVGGALVGTLVPALDTLVLEHWTWRQGWAAIAVISVVVALVAGLFLRNRPEDIGEVPDGRGASNLPDEAGEDSPAPSEKTWTAGQAIRTPQFAVVALMSVSNGTQWNVFTAHGRLHLEDLGFTTTVAAAILGVRVGVSTFGRLSGSLGDFLSPKKIMGTSQLIVAVGLGLLLLAESQPLAYAAVVLIGLGYGAGYISIPVVAGGFFGRSAFAGSAGLRIAIAGVAGWLGPRWAGAAADATGSYLGAFAVLALLCVTAAIAIFICPDPGAGPRLGLEPPPACAASAPPEGQEAS